MAGHIGADTHVKLGRGRKPKMGIKAYDSVDLAYRYAETQGDLVQLLDGKIAELALNGS